VEVGFYILTVVEEIEFFRLLHNGRKEVIEMTAVALKHC
jgi:hypothetical protein